MSRQKPGSGWRWAGIAAILLVAVLAGSAWIKQHSALTVAPGDSSSSAAKAPKPRPQPATGEPLFADPREVSRARPERERTDRRGDKQRPALEEYRK